MDPRVAQSALAPRRSGLGRPLLWSLGGHAALVVLVAGYAHFFGGPRIDLEQKPIQARLVRRGQPRDQKLLPRKEEEAPPQKVEGPKEPVPIPSPEAPQKPAVAIAGLKPDKSKAKAQAGAAEGDRRKKLFGAFDKLGKAPKPEELEGDPNGSDEGDSATAEGEQYHALLAAQIKRNYDVSSTIPEQERLHLVAWVHLVIGRTGEVIRSELVKPSGNSLFDGAVLLAVKKAAPFSPPPEHLRADLQKTGVTFEFRP